MTSHLTAGQRALIESALRLREAELGRRMSAQQGGRTRAEHARDVLLQDNDDAPQRDVDREVDLALTDLEAVELRQIGQALKRVHEPAFGLCENCAAPIPFDRLRVEPHAQRCVPCTAARERQGRA